MKKSEANERPLVVPLAHDEKGIRLRGLLWTHVSKKTESKRKPTHHSWTLTQMPGKTAEF